ncbi:hypothetical protein C1645_836652 [Glomus cerebriforme]|uniref:Uncharacterized protein n=1 Tax=Glomus cerebriforme TaxID=658196 RepID=A0A397SFW6_9GLOM|nr:hypothetical protein C1645_836652 [Glomus cerebriforme]
MKWSKIKSNIKKDIVRIEGNSGNVERNMIILLLIMGLMAKDNETIIIESTDASEIYKIIEKMANIKNNNNIFWSLHEVKKEKKSKKNGENDKLKSEIIDINDIEETLPLNRY